MHVLIYPSAGAQQVGFLIYRTEGQAWLAVIMQFKEAQWSGKIQASHRKYQCFGFFGFAGDDGFPCSFTTDMVSIFTTRP
jgi:hypothetical protein